jgi:hypothetical protein
MVREEGREGGRKRGHELCLHTPMKHTLPLFRVCSVVETTPTLYRRGERPLQHGCCLDRPAAERLIGCAVDGAQLQLRSTWSCPVSFKSPARICRAALMLAGLHKSKCLETTHSVTNETLIVRWFAALRR